jgi:MFS family permease
VKTNPTAAGPPQNLKPAYFLAWLLCAIFYAFQYAVRSAPGVMQLQLSKAWGGNHIGAMISAYYIAYAFMALVAGILLDRYGARRTIPYGIFVVGVGCLVFSQGSEIAGMIGFVLQAIGAIFAFLGSSYVAARYLPGRMLAIFIGLTQAFGMAGASFGAKPVYTLIDPIGSFHIPWQSVWIGFSVLGVVLAVATWIIMPNESGDSAQHHGHLSLANVVKPFRVILANPQSWMLGIIGGLLFLPTTIGALVWAVSFLHGGQHVAIATAASEASMVPIGWVIGCPLLGYIADKLGRRKPVLIAGALIMLAAGLAAIYLPLSAFPPYVVALVLGIGSGAAMIPFSMMKETNPPQFKGTAAGVMNFLVFGTSGVMSPVIARLMFPAGDVALTLHEFQVAFAPLVVGVVVAIVLSAIVHETGSAARRPHAVAATSKASRAS